MGYPLEILTKPLKMAIDIVSCSIKNSDILSFLVYLPEGISYKLVGAFNPSEKYESQLG